jgi:hypothetical protein
MIPFVLLGFVAHPGLLSSTTSTSDLALCMDLAPKVICSTTSGIAQGFLEGEYVGKDALPVGIDLGFLPPVAPHDTASSATKGTHIVAIAPSDHFTPCQASIYIALAHFL